MPSEFIRQANQVKYSEFDSTSLGSPSYSSYNAAHYDVTNVKMVSLTCTAMHTSSKIPFQLIFIAIVICGGVQPQTRKWKDRGGRPENHEMKPTLFHGSVSHGFCNIWGVTD